MNITFVENIKRPARFGSFSKIPTGLRPVGILLYDPHAITYNYNVNGVMEYCLKY